MKTLLERSIKQFLNKRKSGTNIEQKDELTELMAAITQLATKQHQLEKEITELKDLNSRLISTLSQTNGLPVLLKMQISALNEGLVGLQSRDKEID